MGPGSRKIFFTGRPRCRRRNAGCQSPAATSWRGSFGPWSRRTRPAPAARVGIGKDCPFDLHALLPVPAATLALGATHPDALAWLATHWGVTDRLRQVVLRPGATANRRLPRGHAVIGYGFFTAGETPDRAIATLTAAFSPLRFVLAPRPAD